MAQNDENGSHAVEQRCMSRGTIAVVLLALLVIVAALVWRS